MLIFDYDGVIIDSLDYNLAITNRACALRAPYARHATPTDLAQLPSMSFDELAALIGVKGEDVNACLDEINRLLAVPNQESQLFPSMAEIIRQLSCREQLAIVSHNTEHAINYVMRQSGLHSCFSDILGHETPGDKAEQIIWLLEKYRQEATTVWMIGDSVSDITAAQAAGVKSAAVTWGFQAAEILARVKPDVMLEEPQQLYNLIAEAHTK